MESLNNYDRSEDLSLPPSLEGKKFELFSSESLSPPGTSGTEKTEQDVCIGDIVRISITFLPIKFPECWHQPYIMHAGGGGFLLEKLIYEKNKVVLTSRGPQGNSRPLLIHPIMLCSVTRSFLSAF